MKELSIEEKAKRYDEIIEKFDVILNLNTVKESGTIFADDVRKIIPELIENEDEEIRKHIIQVFRDHFNGEDCDKCIAWLEKQGEQKPADKVEPRFKPGDWITDGNITIQIEAIKNNCYLYCGDCYLYSTKNADKVYHLWTIQDAKDGDILVCGENKRPFIFKGLLDKFHPYSPVAYCGIDCVDKFFITRGISWWTDEKVEPATKEQYNQLFKKMEEAGYMWDSKNKELQKIKQKPTNNQFTPEQADVLDKHIDEYLEQKQDTSTQIDPSEYINDMGGNGCYLKNTIQSPTWSDEDFYMLGQAIKCVNNSGKLDVSTEEIEDWLKSFKDRIQPQPKQEWSEDDERIYKSITYSFVHNYPLTVQQQEFVKSLKDRVGCETNCTTTNEWSEEDEESILEICNYLDRMVREDEDNQATLLNVQELKNWLKSLRPQKHWKPTGAQLASLEIACDRNDRIGFELIELLKGLKKYGGCSMLPQWKPSDEQLIWLYRAADDASKDSRMKQVLNELLLDLKKLREK